MRKAVIVAVLAAAVLSSCSTKSKSSSTSAPTTVGGAPTSASSTSTSAVSAGPLGQGVTDTTIRVGITYVDLAAIRSVTNIDHGDYQTAFTAIVDDINANGGINGRKIVPYFAPINPIGTAPAADACTKLTEDDKVFAVIGFFNGSDPLCYLVTHGVPIVSDGPATGASLSAAQQQQAKAPWFSYILSDDHLVPKEIDAFNQQSVFAGHKVAVVGMAQDQQTVDNVVLPELRKLGVNVVQTAINSAPPTDTNATYQQFELIAQKFQALGADVVIAAGAGASQTWPQALTVNRSTYLPRLVATSYNSLRAYLVQKGGYNPAVLQNAVSGNSQVPAYDGWQDAGMQHCVSVIEAAHPSEPVLTPTPSNSNGEPQSWVSAQSACATVTLFAAIAKAAGATLNISTFLKGGESLTNFSLPGSDVTGPLNFSPDFHDGNAPIVTFTWDQATKQFVSSTGN